MKAWQLIEKEENWSRGKSRKPGVYCAIQAIDRALYGDEVITGKRKKELHPAFSAACLKAAKAMGGRWSWDVIAYNDTHTHAEVFAALKAADV